MKTINGRGVEVVKVGSQVRDRRRSTARGTQRYPTVYSWSVYVDATLVMDGCATMREALAFGAKAASR